ncbi:MAG: M23 family metallopeptidase [Clostridia bacterium]|nr:M23 family metallopeptidase [Deltaproteobacteria bacterium]
MSRVFIILLLATAAPSAQAVEPSTLVHVIQPSDRLGSIAKLYRVSEADLLAVNAELFEGNASELTPRGFIKFLSLPIILPVSATVPARHPWMVDLSQLVDDDGEPLMEPAALAKPELNVKKVPASKGPAPAPVGNRSVHLSSVFGTRWGRHHKGIDIPMDEGTPVAAARDGVVERTDFDPYGYGYYVIVRHGARETRYAHLSHISVRAGQEVLGGSTVLGLSGSTGHSTGPHLHYELRINGTAVDPVSRDLPALQMMLRGISSAVGNSDLQGGRYRSERSSASSKQQRAPTYYRSW